MKSGPFLSPKVNNVTGKNIFVTSAVLDLVQTFGQWRWC